MSWFLCEKRELWMNRYSLISLCLIMIFSGAQVIFAEYSTNRIEKTEIVMPAVVVTANRDKGVAKNVSHATSLLTATSLRTERAIKTLPNAFENMPGTMVQKTGNAQGSPYIRGFTGYRNLLLIDGVRLNNSVFRDGPNQYWNTVDPFSIRNIEVLRGPFSVLYGSDAAGGSVNVVTRGVGDIRPNRKWDRHLYYRYGSAENSQIVRGETISRLTDNLALTLGCSVKKFGEMKGGKDVGTQKKTDYDEIDWDFKLEYFITDDSFLVFSHQSVDINDAWRTHKTVYGIDWKGLSCGSDLRRVFDQNRDLTYLQYHRFNAAGIAKEIHAGVSLHVNSEERDRLRKKNRHDIQGFDVKTVGAFFMLKSEFSLGTVACGTEFYHDEVDSFKKSLNSDGAVVSRSIQGPVADDATYDTFGVYIQDEIAFSKAFSLIMGGRCEFAQADADSVENPETGNKMSVSDKWDDIVGNARILYSLNDSGSWNIFTGVSQGFRTPNLSDLTRFDSARSDEVETPSSSLDPEHFVSYEIGLKGGVPGFSAQLVCFHTDIDGMIVRVPTGREIDGEFEVTKKNAGDGYIQGVEVDGSSRLWREFSIFGAFTWIDGRVETYPTSDAKLTTEYIDRLMPPSGRFGLRWERGGRYWAECSCRVAAKADKLSSRDKADRSRIPPGGTPGYKVYDIRAGWNHSANLSLSIALENVANADYRIHGSGVNEPGRNIVAAVDLTF